MTNMEKEFCKEFNALMRKYSIDRASIEHIETPHDSMYVFAFWSNGRTFMFDEFAEGKFYNVLSEIPEIDVSL